MEKKVLGKQALAALLLIAATPAAAQAMSFENDNHAVLSAQFKCGNQFQNCGGKQTPEAYDGGYSRSNQEREDDYRDQQGKKYGDDGDRDDDGYVSDNYRNQPYRGSSSNKNNPNDPSRNTTSYQGTTTGPGPNGGYPATPRGVYPAPSERN